MTVLARHQEHSAPQSCSRAKRPERDPWKGSCPHKGSESRQHSLRTLLQNVVRTDRDREVTELAVGARSLLEDSGDSGARESDTPELEN
ncbi:rCG59631, isoform CRA_b [Rattus norvegicus]|uniref:RCG59631, isoform CRA_b n=1 Tax=Rattus norvegicus TaxID=10116 RepID=A6HRW9_RAT|nr:rCG59631, isoform CRA_b [Rattus norvegicus]